MGYKNISWNFQLFARETWSSARHLGLHSSFVYFDNLGIIEAVYFDLSSKIFQDLQQKQFWRIWTLMEYFEYLFICGAIFFLISFLWLLNVTGILDCLKTNSQVKSASHCLQVIVEKSDKILASKQRARNHQTHQIQTVSASTQVTASASNRLRPYS